MTMASENNTKQQVQINWKQLAQILPGKAALFI